MPIEINFKRDETEPFEFDKKATESPDTQASEEKVSSITKKIIWLSTIFVIFYYIIAS